MFLKKIIASFCMLIVVGGVASLAQAQHYYAVPQPLGMHQVHHMVAPQQVSGSGMTVLSNGSTYSGNYGYPGGSSFPGNPVPTGSFLGGGTLSGSWNGPFNPNNQYHGSINSQGIHWGYNNPLTGRGAEIYFKPKKGP